MEGNTDALTTEAAATPRVFVSYSSDDWGPFVEGLATRLREVGVNAWVAEWEIPAGGSLIKKIYGEGLGQADSVIVVLSRSSVSKSWVADELDVAKVKQIEDRANLIPIRIDDSPVPESLRATKWIRIRNLSEYGDEFQRIVESIFGVSRRPEISTVPIWVIPKSQEFEGLSAIEDFILTTVCEAAMEKGWLTVDLFDLLPKFQSRELSKDQVNRAIRRLDAYRYLKGDTVLTGDYYQAVLDLDVFATFATRRYPGMPKVFREIAAQLANLEPNSLLTFGPPKGVPPAVFRTILERLNREGLIKLEWMMSGDAFVANVSPRIEEYLDP